MSSNSELDGISEDECCSSQTAAANYCCNSCNYSTRKNSHLTRHKKKHSRNEAFRCPRCTYSAPRQQDIDRHLKRDHLNVITPRWWDQSAAKCRQKKTRLSGQEQLEMPSVESRWR